MLTTNHRKEALSRSLVQAVAGRCGMICSHRDFDYGIDVTVHDVGSFPKPDGGNRYVESGFNIDIQAKCTSGATIEDDEVVYSLEVKNYHDLRATDVGTPRILVLMLVPDDDTQWLNLSEDQLIMRRCAYWLSLKGAVDITNTANIQIRIPRTNLFTADMLNDLMQKRKQGQDLT